MDNRLRMVMNSFKLRLSVPEITQQLVLKERLEFTSGESDNSSWTRIFNDCKSFSTAATSAFVP